MYKFLLSLNCLVLSSSIDEKRLYLAVFIDGEMVLQERLNLYREKFQRCKDQSKGKD